MDEETPLAWTGCPPGPLRPVFARDLTTPMQVDALFGYCAILRLTSRQLGGNTSFGGSASLNWPPSTKPDRSGSGRTTQRRGYYTGRGSPGTIPSRTASGCVTKWRGCSGQPETQGCFLVPKLPFGNVGLRNSVSRPGKRPSLLSAGETEFPGHAFPNRSLGTRVEALRRKRHAKIDLAGT